jgi:hypothetical protein
VGATSIPRSAGRREKSPAAPIDGEDNICGGGDHPTRAGQAPMIEDKKGDE